MESGALWSVAKFKFNNPSAVARHVPKASTDGRRSPGREKEFLASVLDCIQTFKVIQATYSGPSKTRSGTDLVSDSGVQRRRYEQVRDALMSLQSCLAFEELRHALLLKHSDYEVFVEQIQHAARTADENASFRLSGRPSGQETLLLRQLAAVWRRYGGGSVANKNNAFASFAAEVSSDGALKLPVNSTALADAEAYASMVVGPPNIKRPKTP